MCYLPSGRCGSAHRPAELLPGNQAARGPQTQPESPHFANTQDNRRCSCLAASLSPCSFCRGVNVTPEEEEEIPSNSFTMLVFFFKPTVTLRGRYECVSFEEGAWRFQKTRMRTSVPSSWYK